MFSSRMNKPFLRNKLTILCRLYEQQRVVVRGQNISKRRESRGKRKCSILKYSLYQIKKWKTIFCVQATYKGTGNINFYLHVHWSKIRPPFCKERKFSNPLRSIFFGRCLRIYKIPNRQCTFIQQIFLLNKNKITILNLKFEIKTRR